MPTATSAGVATLRSRRPRPPATRTVTEFVSFILTQCGINVKRKMVLLLDLFFYHYFVLIKYENYYTL